MGGRPKLTIELMQKIASEKSGKCLSKTYTDTRTKLKWQCAEGHVWESIPHHVKNGSWCPICGFGITKSKQRGSLSDSLAIIKARGGTCLTEVYENCKTKIKVRCSEGHEWEVQPINLTSRDSWCPHCSKNAPCDINEFHELAKKRGGKCLSKEYKPQTKLLWECAEGHQWEATQSSVTRGSWCPRCSKHISEELCRIAFESIFEHAFVKARPKWFRNSKGNLMELDGYCKELGIAFEHQGLQHFKEIGFFQTGMPLKQRKTDDLMKKKLCKKHGVNLIEILQIGKQTPLDDLSKIITRKCRALGISVRDIDSDSIPYEKAYTQHTKQMRLRLDEMVKAKGGKVLFGHYLYRFKQMPKARGEDFDLDPRDRGFPNGVLPKDPMPLTVELIEEMKAEAEENYQNRRPPSRY